MANPDPKSLRVVISELSPGIWQCAIGGHLDWSNFGQVETALEKIFKKGVYKIVVNLREAKYISSAGFGCFIGSLDTAIKNKGNIVFAATPAPILDVFSILGLSNILRFVEDEKAALAAFGP